ncbi:hypothetical protein BU24DRAFT_442081 [Aaosphaeria arxii CBS 175.79]|uniref:Neutral protease 2 n=1 Tax=Aaosphaeria arxii CBS 175.79 TaxID=1450172 RepID=A0A6A5XRC0_9PLEO|nr:uncharacterized protein BU24DRAFT_442081 [Aaosphaeria arxii CBS 175.79]KAF2014844.1 hypothetical protein BU24DRAFT_442081 [Aaosphaeria arxii CBS 175.79]
MKAFIQVYLAVYATYAYATPFSHNERGTPLDIVLTASGNTEVKITITNNGDRTLNLLNKGTFLDEDTSVEKVTIYSPGGANKLPFEGIKLQLLTSGLKPNNFLRLATGETRELTTEMAAVHSLEAGGAVEVFAEGLLPFAEDDSTELVGALPYHSNKLSMNIDGSKAASVPKAIIKRTVVGSNCSGSKLSSIRTALSNCQKLASAAASAASAGTKLDTYFKSTSSSTKSTVSARLRAVAADCGGSGSATSTNCNDPYSACSSNVLAYTVPSQDFITYCPLFFNELPDLASQCHGQDKATTVLHEETHAPGVYSPGTDDLAYGFAAASRLSASQALNNADSYALYANAINLNC